MQQPLREPKVSDQHSQASLEHLLSHAEQDDATAAATPSIFNPEDWKSMQNKMKTPKKRLRRKQQNNSEIDQDDLSWGNVSKESAEQLFDGLRATAEQLNLPKSEPPNLFVSHKDQVGSFCEMFAVPLPNSASRPALEAPQIEHPQQAAPQQQQAEPQPTDHGMQDNRMHTTPEAPTAAAAQEAKVADSAPEDTPQPAPPAAEAPQIEHPQQAAPQQQQAEQHPTDHGMQDNTVHTTPEAPTAAAAQEAKVADSAPGDTPQPAPPAAEAPQIEHPQQAAPQQQQAEQQPTDHGMQDNRMHAAPEAPTAAAAQEAKVADSAPEDTPQPAPPAAEAPQIEHPQQAAPQQQQAEQHPTDHGMQDNRMLTAPEAPTAAAAQEAKVADSAPGDTPQPEPPAAEASQIEHPHQKQPAKQPAPTVPATGNEQELRAQITADVISQLSSVLAAGPTMPAGLEHALAQLVQGKLPSHKAPARPSKTKSASPIDLTESPDAEPTQAARQRVKTEPTVKQEPPEHAHKPIKEELLSPAPRSKRKMGEMWRERAAQSIQRRKPLTRRIPSWSSRGISPEPNASDVALAGNILDEIGNAPQAKRRKTSSQPIDQQAAHEEVSCIMIRQSQFDKLMRTQSFLQTYAIQEKHLPQKLHIILSIENGIKSVYVGTCTLSSTPCMVPIYTYIISIHII